MAMRIFSATLDSRADRDWDGDRLRELRKSRNLRLADLAQFAGLSRQRLGQIEAAAHPSRRDVQHYFDALLRADATAGAAEPRDDLE